VLENARALPLPGPAPLGCGTWGLFTPIEASGSVHPTRYDLSPSGAWTLPQRVRERNMKQFQFQYVSSYGTTTPSGDRQKGGIETIHTPTWRREATSWFWTRHTVHVHGTAANRRGIATSRRRRGNVILMDS